MLGSSMPSYGKPKVKLRTRFKLQLSVITSHWIPVCYFIKVICLYDSFEVFVVVISMRVWVPW
jgi:hypothetical protein